MKRLNAIPVVFFAFACGAEAPGLDAELQAPTTTEARVSISAALDVSDILEDGLADRVVIEDIRVNLAEVRLLAADPRIPPGGYSLLSDDTLLQFFGSSDSRLDLNFPDQFLEQEDLAVYLRISPSHFLNGSSVVVTGRIYAAAVAGGQAPLEEDDESLDPDGDPVTKPEPDDDDPRYGALDPDPDPVMPEEYDCALDPDPDPVYCSQPKGLIGRGALETSVAFELRAHDAADLVATLDLETALNVVVGIPASRWFTKDVVQTLDYAIARQGDSPAAQDDRTAEDEGVIVVEAEQQDDEHTDRMEDRRDDYFVDNQDVDDLTVRR